MSDSPQKSAIPGIILLVCVSAMSAGMALSGSVTTIQRPMPPLNAGERTTLETWLDFYRTTLAIKCDGLDDDQLRVTAPPSPLSLLGLVQHMAEVERNWFRRVLAGQHAPPIYDPNADPAGHDGGFDVSSETSYESALSTWQHEITHARANCAAVGLDDTSPFIGERVSLRWVYVHMIAEYARHCGHADLIRERIDGATGV
jgi:uncharacterized damage-inducible protein DinB